MGKLVPMIFFILFSNEAPAEWISLYGDDYGKHWYDDSRVKKTPSHISLWIRSVYDDSGPLGIKSKLSFRRVNCVRKSYVEISNYYFTDSKWSSPLRGKVEVNLSGIRTNITEGGFMDSLIQNSCNNK